MTDRVFSFLKFSGSAALLLVLAGCASYGTVVNQPKKYHETNPDNYSATRTLGKNHENTIWLAFSGGGTRAAAFAYGVLAELNDTKINTKEAQTALQEVHTISSVSGGSFTSAYYGLYGDQIFENFETDFLRQDIEKSLIRRMYLNPLEWFRRTGRTEQAVKYYNEKLFHGATFADLNAKDGPLLLINSSDLGYGVRFTFVQQYFNLLNSDIASFPIARAVTASSAVPVLFNPVVVMNYPAPVKEQQKPTWLKELIDLTQKGDEPQLQMLTLGASSYFDRTEHKYVHFVDGGITDNLGLRAFHDIIAMGGGIKTAYTNEGQQKPPRRLIVISVNASAHKNPIMDSTNRQPSLSETLGAVTGIQMTRYTSATLNQMQDTLTQWGEELSTPEHPVSTHFIQIKFDSIADEKEREFLNNIPTSFSLTDEQVDALIKAGRELLRNNPDFKKLIAEMQ
jgi:NTE family protein